MAIRIPSEKFLESHRRFIPLVFPLSNCLDARALRELLDIVMRYVWTARQYPVVEVSDRELKRLGELLVLAKATCGPLAQELERALKPVLRYVEA